MNNARILVVGELNIDLILKDIKGLPAMGQEIISNNMDIVLGSSSAIFACNITTLGSAVSFAGMIGNDLFGQFILTELKNRNVDTSFIVTSDLQKTGITVILNYGEERANVTHCGAMQNFNFDNFPLSKLSLFNHLHLSSYFLQKSLLPDIPRLFKAAKEKGLSTSLDLQWDPENKWDFPYDKCLPFVDIFLPNESEICALTGKGNVEDAILKVATTGTVVVVKRGAKGALACERGRFIFSKGFAHTHFVDSVGAGDSFNAGFIFKYINGHPIEESLRFANLTGVINTLAAGGTTAFSTLSAVRAKAKEIFNIEL